MSEVDRERLRWTFTEDAELYDRCRPGYPPRLFDDLVLRTGLGPRSRVLEIGCGTGQATLPVARLGCSIIAVELGAGLAAVAHRKLSGFPDTEIVVSAFEDWQPPAAEFDVVLAATAFHWIDPAVRMVKAADALRPGGETARLVHLPHPADRRRARRCDQQGVSDPDGARTPGTLSRAPHQDCPESPGQSWCGALSVCATSRR